MKWFELAIIFLSVVYAAFLSSDQLEFSLFVRLAIGLVSGLVIGWAIVGLLRLLLWLARLFSKKMPRTAFYVGTGLFWLGVAIGVYLTGLTGYVAYQGASLRIFANLAGLAAFYFVAAWCVRYALKPN